MDDILSELNGKEYIKNIYAQYDVMFCPVSEIDRLVKFIDFFWRKNHPFVISRALLDWQHFDKVNDRYNFVIARHKITREIHSILGFVPTSQFDNTISELYVWPCIWKARDDISMKGLGVSLYHFLKEQLSITTLAMFGLSDIAVSIYKNSFRFKTGLSKHYYILNEGKKDYVLLDNVDKQSLIVNKAFSKTHCFPLDEDQFFSEYEVCLNIPSYKSKKYYINRYFRHPFYKYICIGIYIDDLMTKCVSIFFIRICRYNNSSALRIVDYIGNISQNINMYYCFQKLMLEYDAEYVDFIIAGDIERHDVINYGFSDKDDSKIVIPNYFEPFVKQNIDLYYAFRSVLPLKEPLLFKGDADQDRPNIS